MVHDRCDASFSLESGDPWLVGVEGEGMDGGADGWLTPNPPVEHDFVPCSQFHRDVTKEWRECGWWAG